MALIIYYKSPLNENDKVEYVSNGTMLNALKESGLENEPLNVSINGMIPDEIDLSEILSETDVVEIRHALHGGGNSDTKRTLSTVVQIAALVGATILTGGGYAVAASALLIAGQVAAGALNKWANDILAGGVSSSANTDEVSVETNQFSPVNASNKARPLEPVALIMGSHRYAPDFQTDFYRYPYDYNYSNIPAQPFRSTFKYGINSENGPMAPGNSWITVPANAFGDGWPLHAIKVAPYGLTNKTTALTPTENENLNTVLRDYWLSNESKWINYNYWRVGQITQAFPLVIYHHSPGDPWVGRFNFFYTMRGLKHFNVLFSNAASSDSVATLWNVRMSNIFNGQIPREGELPSNNFYRNAFFVDSIVTSIPSESNWHLMATTNATGANTLPPDITPVIGNDYGGVLARYNAYSSWIIQLNGGQYTSTQKTVSYSAPMYYTGYQTTQNSQGQIVSTQLFNFGIGDYVISERNVGSLLLDSTSAQQAGYQEIIKDDSVPGSFWVVPTDYVDGIGEIRYKNSVTNFPPKKLINPNILNDLVGTTDQGDYNFIYYRGRVGEDNFKFCVRGRLYATSTSGVIANTTRIQIQWRLSGETTWRPHIYPVSTITNDNTNELYIPFGINFLILSTGQYLEVRIRKANVDSTDSTNNKVSDLTISDASFFPSHISVDLHEFNYNNIPFSIEGLYTTSLISDSSTTNKYSALVESKCWTFVPETETWSWQKTRNPAYWFLYFARGGFRNEEAKGQFTYPWSPTKGWVNGPGHPDSTDHIFGAGLTDDQIDIESIIEWSFFCSEKNLKMDMILNEDISVEEALEKISNVGRGSVTYNMGKLSVVWEDPEEPPVCMFGMGNIISGSFSVEYAVANQITKVVAKYTDRTDWESSEVEALVPFADQTIQNILEVTIPYVTVQDQAQREVNILAARQFYQRRTYNFSVDIEGLLVKRGNIALLSHDSTQYGFSGRFAEFITNDLGEIIKARSSIFIDKELTYLTIRRPNGTMETKSITISGDFFVFDEALDKENAPHFLNPNHINNESLFVNSIPEDFIFIADFKETTGKRVRVSQVESNQDGTYNITAVDEDPAMWAYENENLEDPSSFADSQVVASVKSVTYEYLGEGLVSINYEVENAELIQIINKNNNLPLEVNGRYSFSGGSLVLDLVIGAQYRLEFKPLSFVPTVKTNSFEVTLWPI